MRITIIGTGYVGLVTGSCLGDLHVFEGVEAVKHSQKHRLAERGFEYYPFGRRAPSAGSCET